MLSKFVSTLFQILSQLFVNRRKSGIIMLNKERIGLWPKRRWDLSH